MPSSIVPCGMPGPDLLARLINGGSWQAKAIHPNNLRQQCRRLACFFRQPSPMVHAVRPPALRLFRAVARQTRLLTDCHPDQWDATAVLTRLAWYEAHWLQNPETWRPDLSASSGDQWRSLVRHLLAAWPLPHFFESAWLTFGALGHPERDWYCHAARGGSLRTAPGMPSSISARALHLAMQCGPEVTIRQAIRLGQLQACGADPALTREVLASRMVHDFNNDMIWSTLMQKVTSDRTAPPGTFSLITDTMIDIIRQEGVARASRLLQLPIPELYRHSVRWWRSVADAVIAAGWDDQKFDILQAGSRADLSGLACAVWPPLEGIAPGLAIVLPHAPTLRWTFRQLTSQVDLLLEGRHLRHCVASYRRKCETGRAAIFSLRCQDTSRTGASPIRQLTLEIDCTKRRIGQVRGKWNRLPTTVERSLISHWAALQKLSMAA